MEIADTLKVVKSQPNVTGAYLLDAKTLYNVIREESPIKEWLGMPFINDAARTCLDSRYVICVFSNGLLEPRLDNSIVIYDNMGIEIGKMIDPALKSLYSVNENNIWLSNDFVLFSDRVEDGPVAVIMKPIRADFMLENSDIDAASLFYPNRHTDAMLRERYGVEAGEGCSSAIIGFDIKSSGMGISKARSAILEYY